ncbi:MAG: HPF/RaiA family ribosome-associated protein, partial [Bacteroidota bacterium]|nr:HPF/RaiA family ribosome-associated protein [Bacteroidota bacterium]
LKAYDQSDDYFKSLDNAMGKIERQLKRYKSKLHRKEKVAVRRVQEKVV